MGYFLTTSFAQPCDRSHASPKTHVPLSRLQERGLRYYSPELGRWVSKDPIGEKGGVPLYIWCRNSAGNRVDPLGLWHAGEVTKEKNTIVCDGKGGIRLQLEDLKDPIHIKCLLPGLTAHEQCHKDETLKTSPDVCKGKPDGAMIVRDTDDELNATEISCIPKEIDKNWEMAKANKECRCSVVDRNIDLEVYRETFTNKAKKK
jgi:RHS repeat-associated protein